jgi:hypothetical protein
MYLTLDEVATILHCSRRTINRKLKQTPIKLRYFVSGKPLVWKYDLVAYMMYHVNYMQLDNDEKELIEKVSKDV